MIDDKEEFDKVYKVLDKILDDFGPITFAIERVLGEKGRDFSKALIEAAVLAGEMKIASEEK